MKIRLHVNVVFFLFYMLQLFIPYINNKMRYKIEINLITHLCLFVFLCA